MHSSSHHLKPLQIQAGQTVQLWLRAGTEVHLLGGRALLQEPPVWLGERVWQPQQSLGTGQCHVLAHRGWVALRASSTVAEQGAEVLIVPPAWPFAWLSKHQWVAYFCRNRAKVSNTVRVAPSVAASERCATPVYRVSAGRKGET